jgi:hypothetical protein
MTGKPTILVTGGSTGIGLSMQTVSRDAAAGACDQFTAAGRDLRGRPMPPVGDICQFRADRTRRAQ